MNASPESAAVPTALVEDLPQATSRSKRQRLPVADSLTSGIDGILGVDGLYAKRVMVDFEKNRIEIRNSRYERPLAGVTRIPAQVRFGRLMVIPAYVNGVRVESCDRYRQRHTLGNDPARRAVRALTKRRCRIPRLMWWARLWQNRKASGGALQLIKVGDVIATHFDVVFGEFYVFKLWDLINSLRLS